MRPDQEGPNESKLGTHVIASSLGIPYLRYLMYLGKVP